MVNAPFPLQPLAPVNVQVPVIVFPLTAPCRDNLLLVPLESVVEMVIPNEPATLPLKFPDTPNDPVSVVFPEKHWLEVVNLKLVTLIVLPLC